MSVLTGDEILDYIQSNPGRVTIQTTTCVANDGDKYWVWMISGNGVQCAGGKDDNLRKAFTKWLHAVNVCKELLAKKE